jgi:hypothetical protein
MSYRRLSLQEVHELVVRWRAGEALRHIARETGQDRKTVRRYVRAAVEEGLSPGGPLTEQRVSDLAKRVNGRRKPRAGEAHEQLLQRRGDLEAWLIGGRQRLRDVWIKLQGDGLSVSYSKLRRFAIAELDWRGRRGPLDAPPNGHAVRNDPPS